MFHLVTGGDLGAYHDGHQNSNMKTAQVSLNIITNIKNLSTSHKTFSEENRAEFDRRDEALLL